MRIGLYGPMANAGYTLARGLRAAGYDAEYIHEPADRYPMSQPIWEEVELTIDRSRLPGDLPTPEEWTKLASESRWVAPEWIVEAPRASPRDLSRRQFGRVARLLAGSPRLARELRVHLHFNSSRIAAFGTYDWLVVSGMGVIDAFLSGIPYTFWPNGGEVMIVPSRQGNPRERFEAGAMRGAIRGATICGTHDPSIAERFQELGAHDVPFLPFLVETELYAERLRRSASPLVEELKRRARGRPTFFVAARQDYHWKGTDRFLRAFTRAREGGADFFLVLSPWGDDEDPARRLLDGVAADALFVLPGIVSKPLLAELYAAADVVVDQFVLGVHGSTMLEALACETTVMISLNVERFQARWPSWTPPPVLNVSSEEEISEALRAIAANECELRAMGLAGREWVERAHGVGNAHRFVAGPGDPGYAATGSVRERGAGSGSRPSSSS